MEESFMDPKVSVIVVNHNEEDIETCLSSVLAQHYGNYEVIVVDNASTDGSVDYIRRRFPRVRVIANSRNAGFPEAANIGAKESDAKYLAFLNADLKVGKGWLRHIIAQLESDDSVAMSTSKILTCEGDTIHSCGLLIHYTGLSLSRGWGNPSSAYSSDETISGASGGACAIRRDVFKRIGGFDGHLFLYGDDVDLSWRTRLAGYRVMYAHKAIVYHKRSGTLHQNKFYFLERNRHVILLKNYSKRSLIIMIPALIFMEVAVWALAFRKGRTYVQAKTRAYMWIVKNRKMFLEERKKAQSRRVFSDTFLLNDFSSTIPASLLSFLGLGIFERIALEALNLFFDKYYKLVRKLGECCCPMRLYEVSPSCSMLIKKLSVDARIFG